MKTMEALKARWEAEDRAWMEWKSAPFTAQSLARMRQLERLKTLSPDELSELRNLSFKAMEYAHRKFFPGMVTGCVISGIGGIFGLLGLFL